MSLARSQYNLDQPTLSLSRSPFPATIKFIELDQPQFTHVTLIQGRLLKLYVVLRRRVFVLQERPLCFVTGCKGLRVPRRVGYCGVRKTIVLLCVYIYTRYTTASTADQQQEQQRSREISLFQGAQSFMRLYIVLCTLIRAHARAKNYELLSLLSDRGPE